MTYIYILLVNCGRSIFDVSCWQCVIWLLSRNGTAMLGRVLQLQCVRYKEQYSGVIAVNLKTF